MHVFLTGATGLIGRHLAAALVARGDSVTGLSRSPGGAARLAKGASPVVGDPSAPGAWQDVLAKADACVHLAGDPIVEGRWTDEKKRRIRESRVVSTGLVAETIAKGGPGVLVSGSAVGWYGDRGDEVLDEGAAAGKGFLPDVLQGVGGRRRARRGPRADGAPAHRDRALAGGRGAAAARPAVQALRRRAARERPALAALGPPRRHGPARPVRARRRARPRPAQLRGTRAGPEQGARPRHRKTLHRPSFMPAPELAIRAALGEAAAVVLASQRVVPKKALDLGFRFEYPTIDAALRDLLGSRAA
ncbi:MAG: DUF1731 domain-containing protein [Anaeromyxobacteraceae bacterium]